MAGEDMEDAVEEDSSCGRRFGGDGGVLIVECEYSLRGQRKCGLGC
jgi:hypothetical protein